MGYSNGRYVPSSTTTKVTKPASQYGSRIGAAPVYPITDPRNPNYQKPAVVSRATSTYGGSGSYSTGSSESSGGTTETEPVKTDPGLEEDALAAALRRIGAEYGIRIAGPQNALNSMGGIYQQYLNDNMQANQAAQRGVNNQMLERGIYRSGLRNTSMGRALSPIERERSDIHNQLAYGKGVEGKDYGTQALQLQAAVEQLKAAQKNAELERRIQAQQGGLSHDLAMAVGG